MLIKLLRKIVLLSVAFLPALSLAELICAEGNCNNGAGRLVDEESNRYWVSGFKNGRFFGQNAFFSKGENGISCFVNYDEQGKQGLRVCSSRKKVHEFRYFENDSSEGQPYLQLVTGGTVLKAGVGSEHGDHLLNWDELENDTKSLVGSYSKRQFSRLTSRAGLGRNHFPSAMKTASNSIKSKAFQMANKEFQDRVDASTSTEVLDAKRYLENRNKRGGGKAVDYQLEAITAVKEREYEEWLTLQGSNRSKKFSAAPKKELSQREKDLAIKRATERVYSTSTGQYDPERWMLEDCELLGHSPGSEPFDSCLKELIEFEASKKINSKN
ncbi:hypothetical protein N9D87_00790 [bacterium]|nr:hypothetical protein [bacterium]